MMICFTSRRVSIAAIFMWSAVVMLCTVPSPARAMPIEARLAAIIGENRFLNRGCRLFCKVAAEPESSSGDAVASVDATPEVASTPTQEETTGPAATPAPDAGIIPAIPEPSPAVQAIQKTSGAYSHNSNFSPLLVWAIAGAGGATLALF